jgi:hypothetical protein
MKGAGQQTAISNQQSAISNQGIEDREISAFDRY